jgi:hypothetical protein
MIAKIRRHFINLVGHLFRGEDSIGNTDVENKRSALKPSKQKIGTPSLKGGADVDATSVESIGLGDGRRQIVPCLGFENRLPYRIRPRPDKIR